MPARLRFIAPMECTSVASIPEGREWQYELKLDGYRVIAVKRLPMFVREQPDVWKHSRSSQWGSRLG